MGKRNIEDFHPENKEREYSPSIITALPRHPFNFLIPNQSLLPLVTPQFAQVKPDQILLSQDNVNDLKTEKAECSYLLETEDPDLKYLKFKKPLSGSNRFNFTLDYDPQLAGQHPDAPNISLVKKQDYLKVNYNTDNLDTYIKFNDDDHLVDEIVKLFGVDTSNAMYKSENNKAMCKKSESSKLQAPQFVYETSTTQSSLLIHAKEELEGLVSRIITGVNIDNMDEEVDSQLDFWNKFSLLFEKDTFYVREEILKIVESKLLLMIKYNSSISTDSDVFAKLLESCVAILDNALTLDWVEYFSTENIDYSDEFRLFVCVVLQASSIVLLLNSSAYFTSMFVKQDKGVVQVVDFISIFGSVLKSFLQSDPYIELPELFISPLQSFSHLLQQFAESIYKMTLEESQVTRLEYIAFDLVFTDNFSSKQLSVLSSPMEQIRRQSANLIIELYSTYEDQRQFLLNEIVENLRSLSPLKSRAKNLRLDSGITVQVVSYLIVSLIQCHHKFGNNFDYSEWEYLYLDHKTKAKTVQFNELDSQYWSSINDEYSGMLKATNQFMDCFLIKINSLYNSDLRKVIENIYADFFTLLKLPQFPACSVILYSTLSSALTLLHSAEKTYSNAQWMLFEIIALIASKILEINSQKQVLLFDSGIQLDDYELLSKKCYNVVSYLRFSQSNSNIVAANFITMDFLYKSKGLEQSLEKVVNSHEQLLSSEKRISLEILLKEVKSTLMRFMELPFFSKSVNNAENMSQIEIAECFRTILISHDLSTKYKDILSFIISSLNNPKVKFKIMALKTLTMLISNEDALLKDKQLRLLFKQRLSDDSATVIDVTLELILKILQNKPKYIEEYFEVVSSKILSSSVAVKRKTVNLIDYMFANTSDITIKVKLCQALLTQLEDEDDKIIDLACIKLTELLFLGLEGNQKEPVDFSVISFNSKAFESVKIMTGLFSQGAAVWDIFEKFFNERIIFTGHLTRSSREELHKSIHRIVDLMLTLVTNLNVENDSATVLSNEAILGVLSTFVKSKSNLVSQHQLIALQPYFINDYDSNQVCYYALQILNSSLVDQKIINTAFLNTCKQSIMKRLTRFNTKELDQAVQCLWKLYKLEGNTEPLARACVSSLRMLLRYITSLQNLGADFKIEPALPRLIYLIGTFGQYCNLEQNRDIFLNAGLGLKEKEAISVFLLKYLLQFCGNNVVKPLRKVAIKNTMNICIHHPKLFFSVPVSKLIDETFKKKDFAITNIVVGSLLVFLEKEELRMMQKNGFDVKRSSSIQLDIAVFHGYSLEYVNDGICATLVQKYLTNILNICLNKNIDHAINAVKFLKLVVKFGFSNPRTCFPVIVALECSKSRYIRHTMLELHKFLFDKYENLVESTYSESLRMAVRYSNDIYNAEDLWQCSSFLKFFFQIVKQRKSRQRVDKFIHAIIRGLNITSMFKFSKMSKVELLQAQNQIILLAININEIEFETQLELLEVVCSVERIILSEEAIFNDDFNMLLNIFEEDVTDEKAKHVAMSKALLALKCLVKCLIANYSINPELIVRYQESVDKKEFKTSIQKVNSNIFYKGEILDLLTKNLNNQLTLLRRKLLELSES